MGEAVEALREALHPITAKPLDLPAWMQLIIAAVIELDERLTKQGEDLSALGERHADLSDKVYYPEGIDE